MAKYSYKGLTENGNLISGEIEADSIEKAKEAIAAKGYIPVEVKKGGIDQKENPFEKINLYFTPVKSRDLILFTKQLKTMLSAGVPIIQIFDTLENQTENLKLKKAIITIGSDLKEGISIYKAFKNHDHIFSELYCSMLKAGESSGSIINILERLIYIIEHEEKVKSDVKSAMNYPIIVLCFLGVAFFVLLMFVIPKFVTIFKSAGIDLPLPTKICLTLYSFISGYWVYILIFGAVFLFILKKFLKTPKGLLIKDGFLLQIPIIGELIVKASMSRFASIFSILQTSGVPVLEAFDILGNTIGNAAITKQFNKISEELKKGRGISTPLKSAKYFPPMVINMISIGEESGELDKMLAEISSHYDSEVEYTTKQLSDALGPFLTLALAGVVGFFALAIFLPMWDLTKMVN
ncbi:MAG: type II secretion system F family protein [Desulforegulaceae bacterium]|nr:type II secretion system F family protein [Desulforegulaceae bacterium]